MSWDYIMKFVICGEASVGKTSILTMLTEGRFLRGAEPTLGVEFGSKLLEIDEEQEGGDGEGQPPSRKRVLKLQVWDVAGSPGFRSITKSYFRGSAGALLVFDVTRRATFLELPTWLADIRASADENVSIIVCANKVDAICAEGQATQDREALLAEAERWAQEEGLTFLRTSAATGEGVNEAFDRTARQILKKISQGLFEASSSNKKSSPSTIKLTSASAPAQKDGCAC